MLVKELYKSSKQPALTNISKTDRAEKVAVLRNAVVGEILENFCSEIQGESKETTWMDNHVQNLT